MHTQVSPKLIAPAKSGLRPPHIWTAAQDKKLKRMAADGHTRDEIATALGLSLRQIANRLDYTHTTLARKLPLPTNDPLVDQVRSRAFEMHITMTDLDRSLGNQRVFMRAKGHRVAIKHIDKAVKALGGELTIKWMER